MFKAPSSSFSTITDKKTLGVCGDLRARELKKPMLFIWKVDSFLGNVGGRVGGWVGGGNWAADMVQMANVVVALAEFCRHVREHLPKLDRVETQHDTNFQNL